MTERDEGREQIGVPEGILPEIDLNGLTFAQQQQLLAETDAIRTGLEKRLGTVRDPDGNITGFQTVYGFEVTLYDGQNGRTYVNGLHGLSPGYEGTHGLNQTDGLPTYMNRNAALEAIKATALKNGYKFTPEAGPRPNKP